METLNVIGGNDYAPMQQKINAPKMDASIMDAMIAPMGIQIIIVLT